MLIENKEVVVTGGIFRTARLRAECFEWVEEPSRFLAATKAAGLRADLLTFLQELADKKPRYSFHLEWDSLAVLPITSYENWFSKQINGKTRNMIRKAGKCGVDVRITEFNNDLVRGIEQIYNESPLRQGKPFQHYGKDFETLKKAHITFLNKSEFIGAFWNGELIGFVKLFHGKGITSLMQIISKVSCRDKAPTNALIAKAVEICAQRGVPLLHYGVWGRRSLGEFKKHHAFERFEIPRYFVPLNLKGRLIVALGLHRRISDRMPGKWQDSLAAMRARWYAWRYRAETG